MGLLMAQESNPQFPGHSPQRGFARSKGKLWLGVASECHREGSPPILQMRKLRFKGTGLLKIPQ